jgi:hypothetical protein
MLPAVLFVSLRAQGDDLTAILAQAQRSIAQDDFGGAIATLERHFDRAGRYPEYLTLMRVAYRARARQLVMRGQSDAAQPYLDRLRAIEQVAEPSVAVSGAPRVGSKAVVAIAPRRRGDDEAPAATATRRAETSGWQPVATPASAGVVSSSRAMEDVVRRADAAFHGQQFAAANRLYAEVHRAAPERLEAARPRWAYCRMVALVEAINQQPTKAAEWSMLYREAREVAALVPDNDYAKFLVRVVEERRGRTGIVRDHSAIVRASEPEPTPAGKRAGLSGLAQRIAQVGDDSRAASTAIMRRFSVNGWHAVETASFRVFAADEATAARSAEVAERTRSEVRQTWFGSAPVAAWDVKCELFIHSDTAEYTRQTNLGPASPGNSAVQIDGGRVRSRRIDLRHDAPNLLHAVLPHEVTHVVMSDRFTEPPLPRWADEGIAVLSEPADKKQAHLANLAQWKQRGQRYSARQLMTMSEYPAGELWGLFYGSSVSLVDFLVKRGGPERFVEFLAGAAQRGYEPELRRVYGIEGFAALDAEWSADRR